MAPTDIDIVQTSVQYSETTIHPTEESTVETTKTPRTTTIHATGRPTIDTSTVTTLRSPMFQTGLGGTTPIETTPEQTFSVVSTQTTESTGGTTAPVQDTW